MTLTRFGPMTLGAGLITSASPTPEGTVVALRGEVDVFTLPLVVDVLRRATAEHDGAVIVDLAETQFMDSGGVRALARASRVLDDDGRSLVLRSPSRGVARVVVLLGLSGLIESTPADDPRLAPTDPRNREQKRELTWASS